MKTNLFPDFFLDLGNPASDLEGQKMHLGNPASDLEGQKINLGNPASNLESQKMKLVSLLFCTLFINQYFLQNVSGHVLPKSTHFVKSVVLFVGSFFYNDFKLKTESKKTN